VIPENLYFPAAHGPHGWVNCNLRTTFQKIVRRAGLQPWSRLSHNLRASCETDLARKYPIATVWKWISNTVAIAARHYIQVVDSDFDRACCRASKAAQNPAHLAPVRGNNASLKGVKEGGKRPIFVEKNAPLQICTNVQAEGTGLEPATPVKGHLISSEAANQFAYPPSQRRGLGGAPSQGVGPAVPAAEQGPSVGDLGPADQVDELLVGLELGELGGELFHGVHVMHGGEGPPQHGHRVEDFRLEQLLFAAGA
jgi:hypothetical protein